LTQEGGLDSGLFDLARDRKRRGSAWSRSSQENSVSGAEIMNRPIDIQQKTGGSVPFELAADVRPIDGRVAELARQ
jgi:hypothetical protein